jgi:hypothetical protein
MKVELELADAWRAHVDVRYKEAIELGLVASRTRLGAESSVTFVPVGFDRGALTNLSPARSLRSLNDETPSTERWQPRADLFGEAAEWLRQNQTSRWLMCAAGWSRLGDPVLAERKHISHEGRAILCLRIGFEDAPTIATYLRWARGDRLVGICTGPGPRDANRPPTLPAMTGLLLCDALDGDTVIAVDFDATH